MFLKCLRSQPIIGFLGLYLAALDGSWYAVVYGRAYVFQDGIQELKARQVAVAHRSILDREQMNLVERRMKSVPDLVITRVRNPPL